VQLLKTVFALYSGVVISFFLVLAHPNGLSYTSNSPVIGPSANVAQLVEQRTRNAQVTGSSPVVGSSEIAGQNCFSVLACFFYCSLLVFPAFSPCFEYPLFLAFLSPFFLAFIGLLSAPSFLSPRLLPL
jgi:hypothetical protein